MSSEGFVVPVLRTRKRGFDAKMDYAANFFVNSDFDPVVLVIKKYFPNDVCLYSDSTRFGGFTYLSAFIRTFKGDDFPFEEAPGKKKVVRGLVIHEEGLLKAGVGVKKTIIDCGKRFVIVPLTLILGVKDGETYGHANVVIFDSVTSIATRFEPHGKNPSYKDSADVTLKLNKWIKGNLGRVYRQVRVTETNIQSAESHLHWRRKAFGGSFVNVNELSRVHLNKQKIKDMPLDFTNLYDEMKCDLQVEKRGGYCEAWTVLFLHLRLANPEKSDEEIIGHMKSYGNKRITETAILYLNHLFVAAEEEKTMKSAYQQKSRLVTDYTQREYNDFDPDEDFL